MRAASLARWSGVALLAFALVGACRDKGSTGATAESPSGSKVPSTPSAPATGGATPPRVVSPEPTARPPKEEEKEEEREEESPPEKEEEKEK